jgi:GTP-binding protein
MAFLDYVKLNIKAGKGGDGVVRWRRERSVAMGGPAGGDGGRGGNVYVVASKNLHTLHNYANRVDFEAQDGQNGMSDKMHGKSGEDLIMQLPVGTELYIEEYDKTIDLLKDGQKELLFRGGNGGLGNVHFKSSTNQAPEKFTEGKIGEFGTVRVNLKFIADAGFVGFPNAGKSSLLNILTNANSKVGNYNFTTLEPHLGDFFGYVLADIPGLIEGASEGKGLGIKFLKHITRTKFIIHLIEANSSNYVKDYKTIRDELNKFNKELLKKKEIIVISKIDNLGVDLKTLTGKGKITKVDKNNSLPKFKKKTALQLKKLNKDEKLLYKIELQEYEEKLKDIKDKKAFQDLIIKNYKANVKALEKFAKKKVVILSLYDDKMVENFKKVLMQNLKKKK